MFVFLNGSNTCLLAWGLLPADERARFTLAHWFLAALPFGLLIAAGSLAALFLLFRPPPSSLPSRGKLTLQLAVLGPMTRQEIAMLAILVATVVGWMVAVNVKVDMGIVALMGLVATIAVGNLDKKAIKELDWNYLLFFGVALGVAGIAVNLKLDRAFGDIAASQLSAIGTTPAAFIVLVFIVSTVTQLCINKSQGVLLLSMALIPVASTLGVNPWLVAITLLATGSFWMIPSQTSSYLLAYSSNSGRLFSFAQGQRMSFAYVAVTLLALVACLPLWHLMGLL